MTGEEIQVKTTEMLESTTQNQVKRTETLIRIKRKRTEDPLDALLVHTLKRHQVFTYVESISNSTKSDMIEFQKYINRERPPPKQREREVLSSRKLKKAQQDRFKVVNELRDIQGLKIVDVERELDDVTSSLMPMVEEYLNISGDSSKLEYVYDVYIHDQDQLINDVLDSNRVGAVQLDEDVMYLPDDGPDSDYDSEDSNAEDYYTHDYPDEEGSDIVYTYSSDSEERLSSDEDYEYY